MSSLNKLQSSIGFKFNNPHILQQAVTHTSYINENPAAATGDNERMEFLGDALINLFVAEKLYCDFPDLPEGKLTEIRVSLVRQENLAEKALQLKLGDYLMLGKGEDASGGRIKRNNLADAYEALTAAVYLDRGFESAKTFVLTGFAEDIQAIKDGKHSLNYKALLQELTQSDFKTLPEYEVIEATGPDHDKIFCVSVSLGDVLLAIGSGKTKKTAEAEAARAAYNKLITKPDAGN
ncbi:MAG: ribonuclease III [Dehalococcoidia bacterium]|nr:ribonuclease III [Dehalococcoidia bacterium]